MNTGCRFPGRAVEILRIAKDVRVGELVFPSAKANRPLSGMAMEILLRRMGIEDATVHGFRSSFRDWVGDETPFPLLPKVYGDKLECSSQKSAPIPISISCRLSRHPQNTLPSFGHLHLSGCP